MMQNYAIFCGFLKNWNSKNFEKFTKKCQFCCKILQLFCTEICKICSRENDFLIELILKNDEKCLKIGFQSEACSKSAWKSLLGSILGPFWDENRLKNASRRMLWCCRAKRLRTSAQRSRNSTPGKVHNYHPGKCK